jgi:hypothetical protein
LTAMGAGKTGPGVCPERRGPGEVRQWDGGEARHSTVGRDSRLWNGSGHFEMSPSQIGTAGGTGRAGKGGKVHYPLANDDFSQPE